MITKNGKIFLFVLLAIIIFSSMNTQVDEKKEGSPLGSIFSGSWLTILGGMFFFFPPVGTVIGSILIFLGLGGIGSGIWDWTHPPIGIPIWAWGAGFLILFIMITRKGKGGK